MSIFKNNKEFKEKVELFTTWVEYKRVFQNQPGISIGIIYDQDLIWSHGFGYADVEAKVPATADTIYRIASNTKVYTATAIMQLRDQKKLTLDDIIWDYLPGYQLSDKEMDDAPIRIWNLLTHTSGLPREAPVSYWRTAEFPSYEEVKSLLKTQKQVFPAETRWKYSNLAVSLAGMIVENISGMPYEDYIKKHILDPLEMNNTFVYSIDPDHPALAKGYGRRMPDGTRSVQPYNDCKGITPAGNMSSSVNDLAKFVSMQFCGKSKNGKDILPLRTLREMHNLHWIDDSWNSGWGWGFMIQRMNGRVLVGHEGSLMGYITLVSFEPATKIGVVVLTNFDDAPLYEYAEKIHEWIVPVIDKVVKESEESPVIDNSLEKFTAKFHSDFGEMETMIINGKLSVIDPEDDDLVNTMMVLKPINDREFTIEAKSGFASVGESARFEFDDHGKVKRLWIDQNYFDVIETWESKI